MASAEDDFTFPANAKSQPHFIGSPPLWRHLAASRQNSELLYKGEQEEEDQEKSSISLIQEFKASSAGNTFINDDDEEKMDMLWEDLNEEFPRNSGKFSQNTDVSSPERSVQISCIKAMKLSKANGPMISRKKSNILVFIKIVKKAFAIHNSHRSIKKHGKYF
ncbi:uncharacterized protein LOC142547629 [Primulina tabacum]|uniref:uncharacterized protein LOC142547629 n=1 Tax=Primulina tabacum TaxID=48773 RepID=UPI003F592D5B